MSASASSARGKEAGDDLIHTNAHITAGNTVRIQSGGDTTLQGALVKAETIQAEIGGNLLIESLQDTSTFESQHKSASASVTIGVGASGSFSASKSNVNMYRVALHTVAGALGGGMGGAAGAAVSGASANLMEALQDSIQQGLVAAGLGDTAAKGIAQGIATVTAAGVGAAVGGAQGAASAATVDANNRQLHSSEEKWLLSSTEN